PQIGGRTSDAWSGFGPLQACRRPRPHENPAAPSGGRAIGHDRLGGTLTHRPEIAGINERIGAPGVANPDGWRNGRPPHAAARCGDEQVMAAKGYHLVDTSTGDGPGDNGAYESGHAIHALKFETASRSAAVGLHDSGLCSAVNVA